MGLDDNWQHCGSYGSDNFTYHDEAGFPVVNPARFPDMLAMTNHAHKLGLTAGWYLNNCICSDHCGSRQWSPRVSDSDTKCYDGDSAALIEFGFDSVKLDGCGAQLDLDLWAKKFNESGRSIMIENCHWYVCTQRPRAQHPRIHAAHSSEGMRACDMHAWCIRHACDMRAAISMRGCEGAAREGAEPAPHPRPRQGPHDPHRHLVPVESLPHLWRRASFVRLHRRQPADHCQVRNG